MENLDPSWKVLPHDPMTQLSRSVYRVEGSVPNVPLRRVMTVVQRRDGSVLVHSPVATDATTTRAIDALGKVRAIVVPNEFHRLDARAFAERYPDAKVFCPRGGRIKVSSKVRVDGTLDAFPSDEHLRFEPIAGIGEREYAMVVSDPGDTTLVLNDVVFDMPHGHGFHGFVIKHLTKSSGGPRVSRLFRVMVTNDVDALRASLHALADLPDLKRIVVAHHRVIDRDPRTVLHSVAAAL